MPATLSLSPGAPAFFGAFQPGVAHDSFASTPVDFQQAIASGDGLRTGTYAKTLTFTLSTTQP